MLISDPSGGKFGWTLDLLTGTPFKSFLYPGIILAISNGFLPVFIAITVVLKKSFARWLIIMQGWITIGWLTAQLIFNPAFFAPEMHYPTYALGGLLVVIGLLSLKKRRL
jgi:hypothetical protein